MPPLKRNKYSSGFKCKVIAFAKENGNRAAARIFGVNECSVREWKKNEAVIQNMPKQKCALRTGITKWPVLEENVAEWILENRQNGLIITRNSVRLYALQWAKKNSSQSENFKASTSWCDRFMKRKNFVLRQKTKVAQKLPKDLEQKLLSFQKFVIDKRKRENYDLSQIGNMDETPLMFDMIGNKSVETKGAKSVPFKTTGHEKCHFTAVLSCLADGTKLKPMIIFKRKTMPTGNFPTGVLVHVHAKGWMDENGVKLWIKNVWENRPGALRKPKSLLVWDMFRSHRTDGVKRRMNECNTDLAVIPGGLTSLVQPLDVSINKPFKDSLRQRWNMWMLEGDKTFTKGGNMRQVSLPEMCQWILTAWNEIKPEIIVKSFKKCGISNALDGTEDDYLWLDETDGGDNRESDSGEDDIPENINEDEYNEIFMLSDKDD